MSYQPKVYRKQGGLEMVVADTGQITVESGGTVSVQSGGVVDMRTGSLMKANGTQAAAIGAITAATGGTGMTATEVDKFNAMKTALVGVGILAST